MEQPQEEGSFLSIDVLTLFPGYFSGPFSESLLKKAQDKGLLKIRLVDIRAFADNKWNRVDDRPYGGGPGMVLMPGPVVQAIRSVKREKSCVIYLSPQGEPLTASLARSLAQESHLVLLCGHYEGVDERALKEVDREVSIGDYVLSSGNPAAVVLVDAVSRFVPGFMGDSASVEQDSFEQGLFDWPHYTRPEVFEGQAVPLLLRSGNHAQIDQWRRERAREKTERVRGLKACDLQPPCNRGLNI